MKQTDFAPPKFLTEAGFTPILILILLILVGIILLVPLPYYQQGYCNEMYPPTCYPAGWRFKLPLWQQILGIPEQTVSHTIQNPTPKESTPIKSESTSSADISNWKTYKNRVDNYSFKYPPDSVINEETRSAANSLTYPLDSVVKAETRSVLFFNPKNRPEEALDSLLIGISVQDNKNNLTAQQFIDKYISQTYKDSSNPNAQHMTDYNRKEISSTLKHYQNNEIDGLYFVDGFDNVWAHIIQIKNGKIFKFRYQYEPIEYEIGKKHEYFINQILSTFKFLP